MGKIREAFEIIERNLNKYSLPTEEVVQRRLEAAWAKYAEGKLFEYALRSSRCETMQLQHWRINPKVLESWRQWEGVSVLQSSLSKRSYPLAKVLGIYKEQIPVERRIHPRKTRWRWRRCFWRNRSGWRGCGVSW